MSYVRKNLIAGEQLIYETGVHWSVLFWPLLISLLVVAGGIAILVEARFVGKIELGTLLIGFALLYLLFAVLKRNGTEIAVTNRRVIIKTGTAARRSLEIMLQKVESVGIEESTWGHMLGYGTVMIHGTGGTPEPFRKIAHPNLFRRRLQEQVDLYTKQPVRC